MGKGFIFAALVSAVAFVAAPQKSFGLAALATGAKTSCKPTAPVGTPLYHTQVNCDPLGVDSFQLTFTYDPTYFVFGGVVSMNGYDVSGTEVTPGTIMVNGGINSPPDVETDVVGVKLDLISEIQNDVTVLNLPMHFSFAATSPGDFIDVLDNTDPDNPIHTNYLEPDIQESHADESLVQIHADDATSVPLPSAVWGGAGLLGVIGILRNRRFRKLL